MRFLILALLLSLAACNTPGPHFRGLAPATVTVDGSTFDVRVRGDLGEAIRTNPQYAPRFGPIAARAQQAIEVVSGCKVKELLGDQTVALGILDCGDGGQPYPYYLGPRHIECEQVGSFPSVATNEEILQFDCDVF